MAGSITNEPNTNNSNKTLSFPINLMGGDLEIEGLIDPCLPTPTTLASNCSRWYFIAIHFHWLRLLA